MNQIINFADRKVLADNKEAEVEEVSVEVNANDTLKKVIEEITTENSIDDFIVIASNSEEGLIIRSSPMNKKDAFWMLTIASEYAKHS